MIHNISLNFWILKISHDFVQRHLSHYDCYNNFEENTSYIGSYEIKTQDNSFGVVLTLTPDKSQVKTATVVGPENIISQMEQLFNDKKIPVVKTEGKLVTRTPFSDEELIKTMIAKVKDIDNGQL